MCGEFQYAVYRQKRPLTIIEPNQSTPCFFSKKFSHQAFDYLTEQLQGRGLIKQRGRQRTDSLAVLTKVCDLNRLERVCETLRLAVQALLGAEPSWTRSIVPPNWEERY